MTRRNSNLNSPSKEKSQNSDEEEEEDNDYEDQNKIVVQKEVFSSGDSQKGDERKKEVRHIELHTPEPIEELFDYEKIESERRKAREEYLSKLYQMKLREQYLRPFNTGIPRRSCRQ